MGKERELDRHHAGDITYEIKEQGEGTAGDTSRASVVATTK